MPPENLEEPDASAVMARKRFISSSGRIHVERIGPRRLRGVSIASGTYFHLYPRSSRRHRLAALPFPPPFSPISLRATRLPVYDRFFHQTPQRYQFVTVISQFRSFPNVFPPVILPTTSPFFFSFLFLYFIFSF